MSKTPEAKVRDPVVEWAKTHKIMHFRNHMGPGVRKARPDDEFVRAGRVIFVEFKAPGKKPTPLQDHVLDVINEDGTPGVWFDNKHEAIAHLAWFFGIKFA